MHQTLDALIDEHGKIHLQEDIKLPKMMKALVILLNPEMDEWDQQIADDAARGKLDDVFSDDIKEFERGECKKV